MTITRYSFGWFGAVMLAALTAINCIGWSAINVLFAGDFIRIVSDETFPAWGGIVIVSFVTIVVSVYGYRYIHLYEKWLLLPTLFAFATVFFNQCRNFYLMPNADWNTPGEVLGSHVVSFISTIFSGSCGWISYAADFTAAMPVETPPWKVFWLTTMGVLLSIGTMNTMGVLLVSALYSQYGEIALTASGGLFGLSVANLGVFGKFILILLALAVIGNNIPNDYSVSLCLQVWGHVPEKVPRAVYSIIFGIVYTLVACVAKGIDTTLNPILIIITYYVAPYSCVMLLEHFVFRRGVYNPMIWNQPGLLPIGWAAIASFLIGCVGPVLGFGAWPDWWVGPIADLVNKPYGVDIGFELAYGITLISYLILRPIELRLSKHRGMGPESQFESIKVLQSVIPVEYVSSGIDAKAVFQ
eukprot:CAMPEP_0184644370 /NCGR_PEP_ID=MMETSP0308-20130426/1095_1 /TAXON_ID=38269 /ORGANISM="Gloeochaete witrockiana, Strain SAG 46.84" /LENGTH=412 /DNA_ID=CAMNT_0027072855 /DNA_START=280 /DNA_END=1518 /DNA_ORIENTATION=-